MTDVEALQAITERLDALLAQPHQRFYSIASAALYCDLSEDSLRRLIERGDLTPHRPVRGKILIDRHQLDALILGSAGETRGSRGSAARERSQNGRYGGHGDENLRVGRCANFAPDSTQNGRYGGHGDEK
ncbi:MAG: helix-turn-helix domain-containing protein [Planctomycetaceae bacterium]|nr:helix-turn-helix domain-containing protein [Planctomycetaceae bacterium]